jgi:glycine hydroxymethyltransferase
MISPLIKVDPAIATIIQSETKREQTEINLIASENYASAAVRQATGSILTNKYAEGYPGKRYYGGCTFVDEAEILAIKRCKLLFEAEHANVQAHAGSQANMAAYAALIKPGDTIMGMSLATGGHLTHGHGVNFSGSLYKSVQYGVDKETEEINYHEVEQLAHAHRPKIIIAGASAYSRTIDFKKFAEIAASIDAYFMADIAHIAGLVAVDLHPSPVPYADIVTSTTHKTLRGPRGGFILSKEKHKDAVDRALMPGLQGGPFMHIIAAKAVGFHEALTPDFKVYQQQILTNAQVMVKAFKDRGYRIVAGGTDNHLFVLDLRSQNITGRAAEVALEQAGISVSRSCIPFDPEKPWVTSGIGRRRQN